MGRLEIEQSEKCSIWVDSRLNKVRSAVYG